MNFSVSNNDKFAFKYYDVYWLEKNKLFSDNFLKQEMSLYSLDFLSDLEKSLENFKAVCQDYQHLILIGIGGSSLGAEVLYDAFCAANHYDLTNQSKKMWVIDNVDEFHLNNCLQNLPLDKTLVLAISKSGSTLETISQYFICRNFFEAHVHNWKKHFVVITDKEKGFLREEVNKYDYTSFDIPDNLGGRFSIFSAVGLVPAVFLGIDYKSFIQGAVKARNALYAICHKQTKDVFQENFCFRFAFFAYQSMLNNKSVLVFYNSIPRWAKINDWFRQLWAESLGKKGMGSTPVPALGTIDQHSILQLFLDGQQDKSFLFLEGRDKADTKFILEQLPDEWNWLENKTLSQIYHAETSATKETLIKKGIPVFSLTIDRMDEFSLGYLTWNLCAATAICGEYLNVNPFDQPAVEEGKILAKSIIRELEKHHV